MLNQTMLDWFYGFLDVFQEVADDLGMVWWITSGTLMGSYRHHAKIPWDGDIDVLAPRSRKYDFREAFKQQIANGSFQGYGINTGYLHWDKIYAKTGIKPKKPWSYPFLDIFWYTNNGTHVDASQNPEMAWSKILPLTLRPLGTKKYPAPHEPLDWLNRNYGTDWMRNCATGYDYVAEKQRPKEKKGEVKCAALLKWFPFVRHIRGSGDAYCKEELMFKGRVISSFVRSAKDIPVCW